MIPSARSGAHARSLLVTATMLLAASLLAGCARGTVVVAPPRAVTTTRVPSELTAVDLDQIRLALEATSDFDAPFTDRLPYLEDAGDLGAAADKVADLARSYAAQVEVADIRAGVDPDTAFALIDVTVGDAVLLDDGEVPLRRSGGVWRVTRAGVCVIIALVQPCPEPPP